MRRIFLATLLLASAIFTFPQTIRAEDAWRKLYEADTYEHSDGQKLPYRLMKPEKTEPDKTYPLILFLHGGGENGSDNDLHLYIGAKDFAKPEIRQKYPCFVLFPQCDKGSHWALRDMKWRSDANAKETADPLDISIALVEKLMAQLPIDKGRIYVTGVCTGGVGTWTAIQRRPEFFAAAMPLCSGGDTAQAEKLKNLPIWAFHGDQDTVVPVEETKKTIAAIIKAGGNPKMTIYPGAKHNCWSATYPNPEVIAWLFAQKK